MVLIELMGCEDFAAAVVIGVKFSGVVWTVGISDSQDYAAVPSHVVKIQIYDIPSL